MCVLCGHYSSNAVYTQMTFCRKRHWSTMWLHVSVFLFHFWFLWETKWLTIPHTLYNSLNRAYVSRLVSTAYLIINAICLLHMGDTAAAAARVSKNLQLSINLLRAALPVKLKPTQKNPGIGSAHWDSCAVGECEYI